MLVAGRRARKANRLRIKQFAAIATTAGYGLLAGGAFQPLLAGAPLGAAQAIAFCFGVAFLALSIYLQPYAERLDD